MRIVSLPLRSLLAHARPKRFASGQLILYEGDESNEPMILTEGVVKVFHVDDKGQEKVLHLLRPPALLPLDCLRGNPQPVAWYYGALTDSEAGVLSLAELHAQLQTNPLLSIHLVHALALESHELLVRINSMSKSEAKDRLVAALRFLEVYYSLPEKWGWKQIEFPVTHQLLADMTGITRESATIQLHHLQEQGIIRPKRPYIELHTQRLLDL